MPARHALLLLLVAIASGGARAEEHVVGVSWSNFQEERWKVDEAHLSARLAELGARYVSADAQSSSEKQIADLENLVTRGADVLVIVAQDADALGAALATARAEGIPVVAYDRLIEAPDAFYLSFDNREVGRIQAREILAAHPTGRYVFIKGSPQDPNADLVHGGQLDVLGPHIESGAVRVVGDQYVDGWLPELAQRVMEQILTANGNEVDAVVCSNDGMAGGVAAALAAQGLSGIPLSGQDGDHAALNRVALGQQTVSVWKDARRLGRKAAEIAVALADGTTPAEIDGSSRFTRGPRGVSVNAILLEPIPITRANLEVVIDAGWVPRASVCRGVVGSDGAPPVCGP
jgi:D-xylose transport system substrate-binding protein